MARYQVILAYDGTGFFGFQRQASAAGRRTVQAEVEAALRRIGWTGETLLSAGRTDAGVHASGQVIAFDLDWPHGPDALQAALNANLPPDVAARDVRLAAPGFHPRYDARLRRYRYRLFCSSTRDPLRERYAWRVWPALDADRLHAAAALLPGEHDFAAFGSPPKPGGPTLRFVYGAAWVTEPEDGWAFEIAANAFLFHMVRRLVGYQAAVAQGREDPHGMRRMLLPQPGAHVRQLAPPHGLALVEVVYPAGGAPAQTARREDVLEDGQ
jgi:tRNA pseudouridine38-40 synthase